MPWNEPGGSGGRDPWGGRNNEQGSSDLDEIVRKLQNKLGGLFGRRRGPADGGFNTKGALTILAIIIGVWVLSGIYIVDEGKRGVVTQFGAYRDTSGPGPHWYPRFIQSVEVIDVDNVRSLELGFQQGEGLMLTQDENLVDIKFAVQYRVKDAAEYLFNVRDPDATLRDVTESAVREVVGKSKMDFVLTGGRSEIVIQAQQLIQQTLDQYKAGLIVTQVTMQDAQAPEQVQGAFADAVKAREDEQRQINEAEAYANDILPKARGSAARIMEEANAYKEKVIAEAQGESSHFLQVLAEYQKAPSVTRQRMYIDSLESVLSKSTKVVVDTKGGNNLIYLPIDKMTAPRQVPVEELQGGVSSGGATAAQSSVETPAAPKESRVREDLRRRDAR